MTVLFLSRLLKTIARNAYWLCEYRRLCYLRASRFKEEISDLSGRLVLLRPWLLAAWLCGSVAFAHAAGTFPASPAGRWVSADRTIVLEIIPCGNKLCGQIIGIVLAHAGDPMPLDWLGHPQCGMTILQTAPVTNNATGYTRWVGTLVDPRNGNVYRASIALNSNRQLLLRGYFGLPIFGLTQIWQPFSGLSPVGCTLPGNSL